MNDLTLRDGCIAPMTEDEIEQARKLDDLFRRLPQIDIKTDHVLHAGLYARTVMVPEGTLLTGALIKIATLLIISGDVTISLGDRAERLTGYHVLAGAAGRKQGFVAHQDTQLTMVFVTDAETIEQAEQEFTDETDLLLSRRHGAINRVLITGG